MRKPKGTQFHVTVPLHMKWEGMRFSLTTAKPVCINSSKDKAEARATAEAFARVIKKCVEAEQDDGR